MPCLKLFLQFDASQIDLTWHHFLTSCQLRRLKSSLRHIQPCCKLYSIISYIRQKKKKEVLLSITSRFQLSATAIPNVAVAEKHRHLAALISRLPPDDVASTQEGRTNRKRLFHLLSFRLTAVLLYRNTFKINPKAYVSDYLPKTKIKDIFPIIT